MAFIQDVKDGINNLKTLEIRTVIGKFKWNDKEKKIDYKEGEVKQILTQIDLLGGDVTTLMSDDFLEEPYNQIRDFHAEREKRGQEIIEGNLKALKALIGLFLKAKELKE
ncbi:MAG: hypothetical protein K8F52_05435 [Candidatus Scalindua rubra]|uniref:Uncharacterized protein n=1 Tax=Candidatus Scalindua brodae TaxID=237368 RepID=A0A0B0EKS0_9BACT|nr:MAG: hypothetical protein SCABRO_00586 [Candidatus Scalindua brodae]MBZ0108089.1 hypothetical protein [Candidatus Scalindua rubra]